MSRPLTPAERHERALARMDLGSMHGQASQAAPVRRQGPKGRVVPSGDTHDHDLYAQTPEAVVDGPGAVGASELPAPGDHSHPFTAAEPGAHEHDLYASLPEAVDESPGAVGVSALASPGDHKHPFDPDTLGLASDPHGNEAHNPAMATSADFTAHTGNTETAHGADVNATANAIARRNPAGQLQAAPSTAAGHVVVHEEATVNAAANAIARRNASGQTEVGDATAAAHAIPMGQGDTRYAASADLTAHEAETGGDAVHGATPANTADALVRRDASGRISVGAPSAGENALNRDAGDGRYARLSGAVFTGAVTLPNGATTLRFSDSTDSGLQHDGAGAVGLVANGDGVVLSDTDFRPRTATKLLNLGTASRPWQQGQFADVIETTHTSGTGPSIVAAGSVEGENMVADMSSGGIFGSFAAVQAVNSLSDGTQVTIDPKSSSVRVYRVGVGYRPIEASSFDVNSDRATKRDIRDDDRDALADVLATPVRRYRRNARKVRPADASPYGEQPEPEVLDEYEDDAEHIGLIADEAPDDVRAAMGDGEGIDLYAMCSKLWKAVQQQQAHIEELQARLT